VLYRLRGVDSTRGGNPRMHHPKVNGR
jgi:hypothetical protein